MKMDKENVKISVAMATYNGEKFIRQQLDSCLGQTLKPFEIVVVDDCSTDGTWFILKEYERRFPNVHVFRNEENKKPLFTFKRAFSLTQGDFVAPCDQDDIWFEDKLEKCYAAIDEKTRMVFHQDRVLFQDGSTRDSSDPTYTMDEILYSPRCKGHTCLFDRKALEVFDWVDFICYDWALVLWGIGAEAYKQLDYVGCYWRRHDAALTNTVGGEGNFYKKEYSKWGKLFRAWGQLIRHVHDNCIEKDMRDEETIMSHFLSRNWALQPYVVLARCYQKQTFLSMLKAAFCNVRIYRSKAEFKDMPIKTRIARVSWAFRYSYVWWHDLHEYLESIK